MLTLDLGRLEREGRLRVEAEISPEDPLWHGTELTFDGPVGVTLTASEAGSGEIVVRGTARGVLALQCRRCLAPVRTELEQDLVLVYRWRDELSVNEEDGELRYLESGQGEIALGEAVREELVLSAEVLVVCDDACRGLCPLCGVDRNRRTCACTVEERDPRWDALRALKTE